MLSWSDCSPKQAGSDPSGAYPFLPQLPSGNSLSTFAWLKSQLEIQEWLEAGVWGWTLQGSLESCPNTCFWTHSWVRIPFANQTHGWGKGIKKHFLLKQTSWEGVAKRSQP